MSKFRILAPWLCLGTSLLLAWLAYRPGLGGVFHFDDFANLPVLGAMGAVDDWPAFWRYITAGHADPTGRPVALLSFLIDAQDWPTEPYPFLRTNVLLHLANGVLLALLLMRLGSSFHENGRAPATDHTASRIRVSAVLGATFWMLHPLLVSTTLYVIQREAMLPATFVLLGLLLWLHGRRQLQSGRTGIGLVLIALGLGGCTVLATLSKANGILLPAFALLIETAALRRLSPLHQSTTYRRTMMLLAWLPTLLVVAYLVYLGWNGLLNGISDSRPWTLGQRLLTQPRVLMDYLGLLWLPRPFTSGLFNEQVQVSTSLLSPASTLPSLIAVIVLIAGAWSLRRRYPLAALAVLFYFVGHAVESTTIPLELQFEHRNYLPALLMFWPLAAWLCGYRPSATETPEDAYRWLKGALALVLVLGLGMMTYARASLWGDSEDQALLWAEFNPHSTRAQAYAANTETTAGRPDRAAQRLARALTNHPDDVQLALGLFSARCAMGRVDRAALDAATTALSKTREVGGLLTSWFGQAIARAERPSCEQLNLDVLEQMVKAAQSNPYLLARPGRRQDLLHLRGKIALARGKPEAALVYFDRALGQQVRIGFALEQAALLGASGHPRLGLTHLDYYERVSAQEHVPQSGMPQIHAWVLRRQGYWTSELRHLRAVLAEDAKGTGTGAR